MPTPVAPENNPRRVANGERATPRDRAPREPNRPQRAASATLRATAMQAIAAVKPRPDHVRNHTRQQQPPLPQAGHNRREPDMPMLHVLRNGTDCAQYVPAADDQRDRQHGGGGQRPREPEPRAAQGAGQRRPGEQRRRDDRRGDGGERERQQLTDAPQRHVLPRRRRIAHASPAEVGCGVPVVGKG